MVDKKKIILLLTILGLCSAGYAHQQRLDGMFVIEYLIKWSIEKYVKSQNHDVYKTFKEITEQNGFIYEEHIITTDDQYVLKLFRIPGLQDKNQKSGKYDPKVA